MRVGLLTTAIFGYLSGYFFGNFRDKASIIIWRYSAPCRPVTDCKMNELEWSWLAISCQNPFSASISWLRAFDFKNKCVKSNKRTPMLSPAGMQVNDSSFFRYKLFLDMVTRVDLREISTTPLPDHEKPTFSTNTLLLSSQIPELLSFKVGSCHRP